MAPGLAGHSETGHPHPFKAHPTMSELGLDRGMYAVSKGARTGSHGFAWRCGACRGAAAADYRGFHQNFTNPAYDFIRIGAEKIAKAANPRIIHYVPKKPDDVGEQTEQIEQALKDRPDIVIFTPVDDKKMVEPVKKLNDANIPIVLFTNPLPGKFVSYVGADDVELGYQEATYLFKHMGGKGRIVVIEGVPAAPTNRDRVRGYQRAFADSQHQGAGFGCRKLSAAGGA